jgi:Icc-related predicted phosphoesterase
MSLIITGDIHGEFGRLNTFINKKKPDNLIICGDFAYYFFLDEDNTDKIKPHNTKIYWLPGNHENWDMIEEKHGRRGDSPVEIEKNIFYCPIGSATNIEGHEIMFIGGADSYDKQYRILGRDWWQQELLNQQDLDYILQKNIKPDIICSHTCPKSFNVEDTFEYTDKINDPSRIVLDMILKELKPKFWFFGHWHKYKTFLTQKLSWVALNMIPQNKWWERLDEKKEN